MVLRVRSHRGAPPPADLEVHFDAAGGTIGRAAGNLMVLEDTRKYISRVHAAVMLADGCFHLSDQGANPSLVNGRPLAPGATTALAEGDVVAIGDYLLDVAVVAAPVEADPMATMIGAPAAVPAPPPSPALPVSSPRLFSAAPAAHRDALAMASILNADGGTPPADPLALLPDGLALAAVPSRGPFAPAALHDHLPPERQAYVAAIPPDYDPMASLLVAGRATVPAAPPAAVIQEPVSAPAFLPVAAGASGPPARGDEVLGALLEGLGLPQLRSSRAPEDLARLAGTMLRAITRGTMEVLAARALTKRESRIDMTMIAARANNPLKFLPDADSALAQMLGADAPGYLPAQAAIGAAFDDLKAHELAVIAGMRAALAVVVGRFDPARAEQRVAASGRLGRLLPARRKARLWDSMVASYGELVRDADEDLQRLFAEKFSVAYQEQVERMRVRPASQPQPFETAASRHVVE
ncbi:type VI secretion system-associated FHA domain protein TagH [Pseudoduganella umbonata]|uniref:Type VI secretion system-associated FHA domain protein TagH n=1 Tax=Pseudoduganella umbonata TaxID=864828 RepID=A0ABX5US07_9BURK|nr:type VI secretion system-associated FHA domain protein TagH [Pseudoduganella umbonata]